MDTNPHAHEAENERFHFRRWLLGGNTYAQLLGSNQQLNGHHTARGGVSNIELLTRVQEETRV